MFKDHSKFKWPNSSIKYLGIQVPQLLTNLNDTRLWLEKLRKIWSDGQFYPCPFEQHRKLTNECVSQTFIYFHMLPLNVPSSTFVHLDKFFSNFIWQGKHPRIRLQTLMLSQAHSGINVPNPKHYFWVAQLRPLTTCVQNPLMYWLNIEKKSMCDAPWCPAFFRCPLERFKRI